MRWACCALACMGLCAELERPHFTSDSELTAAYATPWSLSPRKLRFEVRQKQGIPCWISHCYWWRSSKADEGFCWGNESAGTGQ